MSEKTYKLVNAYMNNTRVILSTGQEYLVADHELDGYLRCLEDFGYHYVPNEEDSQ